MKTIAYNLVDTFTTKPFAGNQAGVVLNAEDLTESQMQNIARELNASETAFITEWNKNSTDVVIRYFTPAQEVPFCGHATLATAYVLKNQNPSIPNALQFHTKAGEYPVKYTPTQNNVQVTICQTLQKSRRLAINDSDVTAFAKALGLQTHALKRDLPLQVISTGNAILMLPLNSEDDLDRIQPSEAAITEISKHHGAIGIFTFAQVNRTLECGELINFATRFFASPVGLLEDPVTGAAQGCFGFYVLENSLVPMQEGKGNYTALQGQKMGRPGIVHTQIFDKNSGDAVEITGDAVISVRGEIYVE